MGDTPSSVFSPPQLGLSRVGVEREELSHVFIFAKQSTYGCISLAFKDTERRLIRARARKSVEPLLSAVITTSSDGLSSPPSGAHSCSLSQGQGISSFFSVFVC